MKESTKQRLSRALRATFLLPAANAALFALSVIRERKRNRSFREGHPGFPYPPLRLAFDAYNHVSAMDYHDSGRLHAGFIAEIIRETLESPVRRVCEWGCGPARIIRHLPELLGDTRVEMHGTDYSESSISWCTAHITGIEFRLNNLSPPLPYEDAFFDFIYGLSIFTHLSERRYREWLVELHRVTCPGGVILFTTHGNNYAHQLLGEERTAFDTGHAVERTNITEGKKCFAAYHPPTFVRESLPPGLDVVKHMEGAAEHGLLQDIWVLRRAWLGLT